MSGEPWKTTVTKVEPNKLLLRGYRLDELMGQVTFSQAVFLAVMGELPDEKQARMMDAILVASIDHGVTPPSCVAARTIASAGAPLSSALAGGVLAISKHHGGAIEDAMTVFKEAVRQRAETKKSREEVAAVILSTHKEKNQRIPGFGHRFHTEDPRTIKLLTMAGDLGTAGEHVEMARAIEAGVEKRTGRRLPINVDGAIAAVLCEMDFPPELANGLFVVARISGLLAHVREEQTTMRPMRHIHSRDHVYDGLPERGI